MDSIKMIRVKSFVLTGTVVLKRYLSRASSLVEKAGCIGLDLGYRICISNIVFQRKY
jgi:hypothetical protein